MLHDNEWWDNVECLARSIDEANKHFGETQQTADLTGAALDWAVAHCADLPFPIVYDEDGREVMVSPSTDWAQGGLIIEREWIDLHCVNDALWEAEINASAYHNRKNGSTPLIAAMRCYVASKFGDTVDIPEELMPTQTP